MWFLCLGVCLCDAILLSLYLLLLATLSLSFYLVQPSLLISLLVLLVYLGSLMVIITYMWMFITSRAAISHLWHFCAALCAPLLFSPTSNLSTLVTYLYPTCLLLFLVCLLFWAMLVVVSILDLGLGSFRS